MRCVLEIGDDARAETSKIKQSRFALVSEEWLRLFRQAGPQVDPHPTSTT